MAFWLRTRANVNGGDLPSKTPVGARTGCRPRASRRVIDSWRGLAGVSELVSYTRRLSPSASRWVLSLLVAVPVLSRGVAIVLHPYMSCSAGRGVNVRL
jgi:hypothetical protein